MMRAVFAARRAPTVEELRAIVDELCGEAPEPPPPGAPAYLVRDAAGAYFARAGVFELWVQERERAAPMNLHRAIDIAWDWDHRPGCVVVRAGGAG
jgi:hypothetical protein